MQQQQKSCNIYPLGKMIPIVHYLSSFLSIQPADWVANWDHAIENDDFDKIRALLMLSNVWKQNEVFYKIPDSELLYFGKIRYSRIIFQLLCMLKRNNYKKNRKLTMTLTEMLRYFYTKFREPKDYAICINHIDFIIYTVNKLIVVDGGMKNKTINQYKTNPQFKLLIEEIQHWVKFFDQFDFPNTKRQRKSLQNQFQHLCQFLVETKCFGSLSEAFLSIRAEFLIFCDTYYKQEWSSYPDKCNHSYSYSNGNEKTYHHLSPIIQPINEIKLLQRDLTNLGHKPKLLFIYFRVLMLYLPRFLIFNKSENQKMYVLNKLYTTTLEVLIKMYDKRDSVFHTHHKNSTVLSAMDLVKAFSTTKLLNNLESALVANLQNDIVEHKDVREYVLEYNQILQYFRMISQIKKKIVIKNQELVDDFTQKWTGYGEAQQIFKEMRQNSSSQNQNLNEQQLEQGANYTRKSKPVSKQKLQVALNIKSGDLGEVQQLQKTQVPSKSRTKPNKGKGKMDKIEELAEEENQQQASKLKTQRSKSKSNPKPLAMPNSKLVPLKTHNSKKLSKNSQLVDSSLVGDQSLDTNDQDEKDSRYLASVDLSKSSISTHQEGKQLLNKESKSVVRFRGQKRGLIVTYDNFCSYFQHHSHSYNVLSIFRECTPWGFVKQQSLGPDQIDYHRIYYPQFVNTEIYRNHFFENVESTKQFVPAVAKTTLQNKVKQLQIKIYSQLKIIKNPPKFSTNHEATLSQKQMLHQLKKTKIQLVKIQTLEMRNQKTVCSLEIQLFPLTFSKIGQQTVKTMVACLQEISCYLILNKESNRYPSFSNPYNQEKMTIKQMEQIDVQRAIQKKLISLLFCLLFEILIEIKLNLKQKGLRFLYEYIFNRLPIQIHGVLLYYITEVIRLDLFRLQKIVKLLFEKFLTEVQLINIIKFLIQDCKINTYGMSYCYFQLLFYLNRKIVPGIKKVVGVLCQQLVPQIKDKNLQRTKSYIDRQHIDSMIKENKLKLAEHFSNLIEMINLSMFLTLSLSKYYNVKSQTTIIYHCQYCAGMRQVGYYEDQENIFQQINCLNCPNTVLTRFQIYKPHQDFKQMCISSMEPILQRLHQASYQLESCFELCHWIVQPMLYRKYLQPTDEEIAELYKPVKYYVKASNKHISQNNSVQEGTSDANQKFKINESHQFQNSNFRKQKSGGYSRNQFSGEKSFSRNKRTYFPQQSSSKKKRSESVDLKSQPSKEDEFFCLRYFQIIGACFDNLIASIGSVESTLSGC